MKHTNHILRILLAGMITLVSLAGAVSSSSAQEGEELSIALSSDISCGEVQFTVSWAPDEAQSYLFYMDFGDGDSTGLLPTEETSLTFNHTYVDQGDYELYLEVIEADFEGYSGTLTQLITLEGPDVSLTSEPFPPMFLAGDDGQVTFSTEVLGGTEPFQYQWDLDGDGAFEETEVSSSAAYTYSEVGEYSATVKVSDNCGFTDSASMPVVVAEEEDVCHPMAQKIAAGINSLLPEQREGEYTCEDIYTLFENPEEENNLGFGRMWMAYKLAESIEMTWEEILAWHLDESGWGTLLQLNRYSDLLEEKSLGELVGLVMSEDYTMNDVRTAVRTVTRYEADFEDALTRVAEGATPGELTQLYKLAADLETDPETLDVYLADGLSLAELKHTSTFADRMGADWIDIAALRTEAESWGDINQAFHLADDQVSAEEILIMGVQEYRESLREEAKDDQESQKAQKEEERNQQTAEKLAEQYSAEFGDVINLLNGECEGDWACVRSELRDQTRKMDQDLTERDNQTALQIAAKYGYTEDEVLGHYQDVCDLDWACTRAYFRNLYMENREKGKPNK